MKVLLPLFLLPLATLAAPNPANSGNGSVTRVPNSRIFDQSGATEYPGDKFHTPGTTVNPRDTSELFKRQWGDCNGSIMCWKLHADLCQEAYNRFDPNEVFYGPAARVGYNDRKNFGFGMGCIAKYECSNGYPPGVTGANIAWEFDNHVYRGGAKGTKCGEWHWDNGCTFALDYCFEFRFQRRWK